MEARGARPLTGSIKGNKWRVDPPEGAVLAYYRRTEAAAYSKVAELIADGIAATVYKWENEHWVLFEKVSP